jgi:hypothetical protein
LKINFCGAGRATKPFNAGTWVRLAFATFASCRKPACRPLAADKVMFLRAKVTFLRKHNRKRGGLLSGE